MSFYQISTNNNDIESDAFNLFHVNELTYVIGNAILLLAALLAIPGNLLVIWTVIRTPQLRAKSVNLLIVNLCVADCIVTFGNLPLVWIILHFNYLNIHINQSICDLQLFLNGLALAAQATALVTVGYERFQAIANPFDIEIIKQRTRIAICFCWLVAVIIAMIALFLVPDSIAREFCTRLPEKTEHRIVTYVITPFGAICLLLVGYYYLKIVFFVRRHCQTVGEMCRNVPVAVFTSDQPTLEKAADPKSPNRPETPSIFGDVCVLDANSRSLGRRKLEAETAKRSFYVIASFTFICLPYPGLVVVEKVSGSSPSLYQWQFLAHVLFVLSAALNPLVYGLANKQFRASFLKIFKNRNFSN